MRYAAPRGFRIGRCASQTAKSERVARTGLQEMHGRHAVLEAVYRERRDRESRERADALQYSLIESDANRDAAVVALGRLWQSGLFDCGPQDYDFIVEVSLEALSRVTPAETPAT